MKLQLVSRFSEPSTVSMAMSSVTSFPMVQYLHLMSPEKPQHLGPWRPGQHSQKRGFWKCFMWGIYLELHVRYIPGTLNDLYFWRDPTPQKQGRLSNQNKGHQRVPGMYDFQKNLTVWGPQKWWGLGRKKVAKPAKKKNMAYVCRLSIRWISWNLYFWSIFKTNM